MHFPLPFKEIKQEFIRGMVQTGQARCNMLLQIDRCWWEDEGQPLEDGIGGQDKHKEQQMGLMIVSGCKLSVGNICPFAHLLWCYLHTEYRGNIN